MVTSMHAIPYLFLSPYIFLCLHAPRVLWTCIEGANHGNGCRLLLPVLVLPSHGSVFAWGSISMGMKAWRLSGGEGWLHCRTQCFGFKKGAWASYMDTMKVSKFGHLALICWSHMPFGPQPKGGLALPVFISLDPVYIFTCHNNCIIVLR